MINYKIIYQILLFVLGAIALFFGIGIIIAFVIVLSIFFSILSLCKYFRFYNLQNSRKSSSETEGSNEYWKHFEYRYFELANDNTSDVNSAYETLNVPPNCADEELKKAYRDGVKKYHPDVYEHLDLSSSIKETYANKFQQIESAYELLKQVRGF